MYSFRISFVVFVTSLPSGALIMVNMAAARPIDHIRYLKVSHTSDWLNDVK